MQTVARRIIKNHTLFALASIMAISAFVEPAIVLALLIGGTIINRDKTNVGCFDGSIGRNPQDKPSSSLWRSNATGESIGPGRRKNQNIPFEEQSVYRTRELRLLAWRTTVVTRNTWIFRDAWLSKILLKFPFLIEVVYWALVYWVCQPWPHTKILV